MRHVLLAVVALGVTAGSAIAQMHMVLVDRTSVKRGQKVTITYLCGKPYTAECVDAEKPVQATAYAPTGAGATTDLLPGLEKVTVTRAGKEAATGYRCAFADLTAQAFQAECGGTSRPSHL